MMSLSWICCCVSLIVCIVAISVIWLHQKKMRQIMNNLNQMLDEAIDGSFQETSYDESLCSAVESKFARYLAASEGSKQNLSEEKEKIKSLIADISHQTKTPIANILLYAQLLQEKELSEDDNKLVTSMNDQAEKLSFLISSLIKTSRLENGIISVNPSKQEIKPLIREVLKQISYKAENKQINISILDNGLLESPYKSDPENKDNMFACFDMKWTVEAILNIVDNAVKYTPQGGQINISVHNYNLFTEIAIQDNGIGIPEEEHAKIFGRFYRSQMVQQQEGVGIGLYLARQIITAEGGYIKVSSKENQGARFSVFLPRE